MKYLLTSASSLAARGVRATATAAIPIAAGPNIATVTPTATSRGGNTGTAIRLGKKGLARRANLAGGEQAGENRARHAVLCQDPCDKTIGAGLAPALLVLLPFVYVTPRE